MRLRFLGKFLHSQYLCCFPIFEKFLSLVHLLTPIIHKGTASLRDLSSVFGKYLALVGRGALCQSQELFSLCSQILSSHSGDLRSQWSKKIHLSRALLVIFTEWIISATEYFSPQRSVSLPTRKLSLLVDTSNIVTGFVVTESTDIAKSDILRSGSIPLPQDLLHFGEPISSAPSSTLREIWGIHAALQNFANFDSFCSPTLLTVWTDNLAAAHILTTGRSRISQINQILDQVSKLCKKKNYLTQYRFHYRTQFLARIPDFLSNVVFPRPSKALFLLISRKFSIPISRLENIKLNFDFLYPSKLLHLINSSSIPVFVIPLGLSPKISFRLVEVLCEFCSDAIWLTPPHTNSRWFRVFFARRKFSYVKLSKRFWLNNPVAFAQFSSQSYCLFANS